MENLITLLLHLVQKVPYLSEAEHAAELDLLRTVESHLGVTGIVPPASGVTNPPAAVPVVPVPGPVAEPVPASSPAAQAPPPTSPDVMAAPEVSNAFTVGEHATWDGTQWVPSPAPASPAAPSPVTTAAPVEAGPTPA